MTIAIIGGGLTGLTAGYELTKAGHQVSVFEKDRFLGGLAHGFKQPGWDWSLEAAYHHFFTNDAALINLAKEIGLTDRILISRPVTSTYYNGNMSQLDSPMNLLTFSQLPVLARIRTGMMLAYCKATPFWQQLEKVTAESWIKKWGGMAAWKIIWEPLLYGKFNEYAPKVAASWFWARIKKRTASLGYFQGGFQTFVDRLAQQIIKAGGSIHTDFQIENIIKSAKTDLFQIKPTGNNTALPAGRQEFDKVLLTIPTPVAAKIINMPKSYFTASLAIPHLWAQTLILETDAPILDNVYWLNINDRSFPFLAAVAHTNFMDKKHYGNHHLTYFGNYLPDNHRFLKFTKEQLLKEFLPFINRIRPNRTSKFELRNSYLFTVPFAQPVHELHYSQRAPKLETPVGGLYLANLDSIYPLDRGTNYAVELGQKAAGKIITSR
jgi:protoporphyrinogen oxidase